MLDDCKNYCSETYERIFTKSCKELSDSKKKISPEQIERTAQKDAIRGCILSAMKAFPNLEPAIIWRDIYQIHVHHKSGLSDPEIIEKVIRADQSWKKSSGHAFEEMIKLLGNEALKGTGIEILLQRDLNILLKADELSNEPRDISWLKEQIKGSVFDLFVVMKKEAKTFCYGCIQSKTSIRDRVTRDREPSSAAMESFFWSTIIVLDGEFLKNPKFMAMVNGGSEEFPENGWHGMYVFSDSFKGKRIYPIHVEFTEFANHAIKAAKYWSEQRQWFDKNWLA